MPPPPPPPPPPFPDDGMSVKASLPTQSVDRNALLSQIRLGTNLKKVSTNDRSIPQVGNNKTSKLSAVSNNNALSPSSGNKSLGGCSPLGMGDLFAQGMPKLRPTNKSFMDGGAYKSQLNPRGNNQQGIKHSTPINSNNNNYSKINNNTDTKRLNVNNRSQINKSLESIFSSNVALNNSTKTNENLPPPPPSSITKPSFTTPNITKKYLQNESSEKEARCKAESILQPPPVPSANRKPSLTSVDVGKSYSQNVSKEIIANGKQEQSDNIPPPPPADRKPSFTTPSIVKSYLHGTLNDSSENNKLDHNDNVLNPPPPPPPPSAEKKPIMPQFGKTSLAVESNIGPTTERVRSNSKPLPAPPQIRLMSSTGLRPKSFEDTDIPLEHNQKLQVSSRGLIQNSSTPSNLNNIQNSAVHAPTRRINKRPVKPTTAPPPLPIRALGQQASISLNDVRTNGRDLPSGGYSSSTLPRPPPPPPPRIYSQTATLGRKNVLTQRGRTSDEYERGDSSFENRFFVKFHKISEVPLPDAFSNKSKIYPSMFVNKRVPNQRKSRQPPAPPPPHPPPPPPPVPIQ